MRYLDSLSARTARMGCFALIAVGLAACQAKREDFFLALDSDEGQPSVPFDCTILDGLDVTLGYRWVSSTLPGESPLPADFTVPGTFSYTGTQLSLAFPDAPAPITGPCVDGLWAPAETGVVEFAPDQFANERYLDAGFTLDNGTIDFSARSVVDFTGVVPGGRVFDVSGQWQY